MSFDNTQHAIVEVPASAPQTELMLADAGLLPTIGGVGAVALVPILAAAAYITLRPKFLVPQSNEAFVISEAKGKRTIIEGGTLVWGVRRLTKVTLNEVEVKVAKVDNDAVRTQDSLKANIQVTFHVAVIKDAKSVELAAARLSKGDAVTVDALKEAVNARADDAIRGAAKLMSLDNIDMKKADFEEAVRASIAQDLAKIGLEVLSVSVSEITEADYYNERDFLDLQGHSLRTGAIEEGKRRSTELQEQTELLIKQRRAETEQRQFELESQTATAKARHQEAIKRQEAEVKAKIESSEAEQSALAQAAKAAAQRRILEEQKLSIEAEREVTLAKERLETTKLTEQAEREKALALIKAAQEAEVNKQEVLERTSAEAQAEIRKAEAAVTVEKLRAEALTIAALAEKEAAEARAEGTRAINDAQNSATITAIVAQFLDKHGEAVLDKMPEILEALAPKAGVLGSPTIISGNGQGMGDMLFNASAAGIINLISQGGLEKLVERLSGSSETAPRAIDIEEESASENSSLQ